MSISPYRVRQFNWNRKMWRIGFGTKCSICRGWDGNERSASEPRAQSIRSWLNWTQKSIRCQSLPNLVWWLFRGGEKLHVQSRRICDFRFKDFNGLIGFKKLHTFAKRKVFCYRKIFCQPHCVGKNIKFCQTNKCFNLNLRPAPTKEVTIWKPQNPQIISI